MIVGYACNGLAAGVWRYTADAANSLMASTSMSSAWRPCAATRKCEGERPSKLDASRMSRPWRVTRYSLSEAAVWPLMHASMKLV